MPFKHGESKRSTAIYNCWLGIKDRCFNTKCQAYKYYGGRGINMYKPWIHNYVAFRDWIYQNLGLKPDPSWSIDRIDNDGNYEPGNLRWATAKMQESNRRRRKRDRLPLWYLEILARKKIPADTVSNAG